jgi:hypothetical protein
MSGRRRSGDFLTNTTRRRSSPSEKHKKMGRQIALPAPMQSHPFEALLPIPREN